jgi:hypothetical protein
MEDSRELGRSYDFLVEYRKESVNTPAVFCVREDGIKNHRTRARYCQAKETKCGEMNVGSQSALIVPVKSANSTREESREGSEVSEF